MATPSRSPGREASGVPPVAGHRTVSLSAGGFKSSEYVIAIMNRLKSLLCVGIGIAAAGAVRVDVCAVQTPARNLPNLVVFVSDDHSRRVAGCYGDEIARTPNMDRLAREGMRFNCVFTSVAMCAPSRKTLATGLYPHRHGLDVNGARARPGTKGLKDHLTPLGYRVVKGGKGQFDRDRLEQILTEHVSKPLCLFISSREPHSPWKANGAYDPRTVPLPPTLVDTHETRRDVANYYSDVTLADAELGQCMELLEEHGFDDNTCLIYTSDHGCALPFGKWTCYDEGLNVPLIVRWPGRIRPGSVSDALIGFVDVLPTFIEMAGGRPVEDMDGRSFLPVLLGHRPQHNEVIFSAQTTKGIAKGSEFPIRAIRTTRHKYIMNLKPNGVFQNLITEGLDLNLVPQRLLTSEHPLYTWDPMYSWRSWKKQAATDAFAAARVHAYQHRPPEELYDLNADPFELRNLAADPSMRELKMELRQQLVDWMKQQNDPLAEL